MGRIVFITGTDTGVGKTVLTGLLLYHLRRRGVRALAMKPFCSGDRGDVEVLQGLQRGELADEEMNPFYFRAPLAPLVAARAEGRRITLPEVLQRVSARSCEVGCLLVEGCGGLLTPLGEGFALADVIAEAGGEVVVVAPNRLGVINQVCLTVNAHAETRRRGDGGDSVLRGRVVLMGQGEADLSVGSNAGVLREVLGRRGSRGDAETWNGGEGKRSRSNTTDGQWTMGNGQWEMGNGQWEMADAGAPEVVELDFFGSKPLSIKNLEKTYKKVKKCLQGLVDGLP